MKTVKPNHIFLLCSVILAEICFGLFLSAADLPMKGYVKYAQPPVAPTALWNGHDLTGWTFFFTNSDIVASNIWRAKDGRLQIGCRANGYLRTENTFSNYQLHVEWRWPQTNGNSGVFVHINGADAIWPACVECQLKIGTAGELIGQGGVTFPAPVINGKHRAKIDKSSEVDIGDWNSCDILCRGNSIEVYVNGVRKNRVENVSVTSGRIGLQLEGFPVEFRIIWIKPLTAHEQRVYIKYPA